MGEEVRAVRSTNRESQNSHGEVKYSIGHGATKEFITHGREQWQGDCLREWGVLGRGWQRGEIGTTVIT